VIDAAASRATIDFGLNFGKYNAPNFRRRSTAEGTVQAALEIEGGSAQARRGEV
jgi:hypothetical protein